MRILLAIVIGAASAAAAEPASFLSARTADGSAHPPEQWSARENVLWKTDLPGLGWSSPIVSGGRVYLTSCVSTGKVREPKKGLYLKDLNANLYPVPKDPHEWKVYALDLDTGAIAWERVARAAVPPKPHHIKNTLASETPATDGERLYVLFGNVGLFCYDLEGKPLWQIDIPPRNTQYGWGTSISPIVHEGRVYLVNDNDEESYLACLDGATGKEIWRVAREEKTNYATPYLWRNSKRIELVASGMDWARSYDLEGKLLWKLKGRSILAIPTPFADGDLLYLTSGHVAWGGNPVYAIRAGASGDISPDPDGKGPLGEHLAWHVPKGGPYHPTPILVDGRLYFLYDRGMLACFDAKTGKEIYGRQRLSVSGFTASPWSYAGKIFCLNEDGVTVVVKAGSTFEILHKNVLDDDDMCMATPAVAGEKLIVRSSARVYCIAKSSPSAAAGGR